MRNIIKNSDFNKYISILLLAISVIVAYRVIMGFEIILEALHGFIGVIAPFIAGFVLAYFLNIPRKAIENILLKSNSIHIKKRTRKLSVLIVYLLFVTIIIVTVRYLVPSIYRSLNDLISNFSIYYNQAMELLNNIIMELKENNILSQDTEIQNVLQKMSIGNVLADLLNSVKDTIGTILGFSSYIFNAFLAFVSSIYFLLETESFKSFLIKLLSAFSKEETVSKFITFMRKVNESFRKFLYCQLLDSLIIGTVTSIEFTLVGSKYAVALGVMTGAFNIIPYFGSIFASIISTIIIAVTIDIKTGLIIMIILIITQQLDGNVIQPKLMGTSFSLSPALIIIAISIGGAYWNVIGMVVAIPVVSILKDLLNEYILYRETEKNNLLDGS